MTNSVTRKIRLGERNLEFRLIESRAAKHLRVRVTLHGVEVLKPVNRKDSHVTKFLSDREEWIESQIERIEALGGLRIPKDDKSGTILFQGERVPFRVELNRNGRINRVIAEPQSITLKVGGKAPTSPDLTLNNWFRRQARAEIESLLPEYERRLKRSPNRIYVMEQRTKWGNCSPLQNLSFNWRLILAPPFVLRYLVAHEMVHLVVPDHSARFWLTLQSFCGETDTARQWLANRGTALFEETIPDELAQVTEALRGMK